MGEPGDLVLERKVPASVQEGKEDAWIVSVPSWVSTHIYTVSFYLLILMDWHKVIINSIVVVVLASIYVKVIVTDFYNRMFSVISQKHVSVFLPGMGESNKSISFYLSPKDNIINGKHKTVLL